MVDETTKLKLVPDDVEAAPIPKPEGFSLDKFTSKSASTVANVETLQTALPHYTISKRRTSSVCTLTRRSTGLQNFASSMFQSRGRRTIHYI